MNYKKIENLINCNNINIYHTIQMFLTILFFVIFFVKSPSVIKIYYIDDEYDHDHDEHTTPEHHYKQLQTVFFLFLLKIIGLFMCIYLDIIYINFTYLN
jgi:Ca2+/Na+ antiporter